jgi:hypothetical protein
VGVRIPPLARSTAKVCLAAAGARAGVLLDDGEPIVTIKDLFRFAGLLPVEPS